jgi:Holliday junction resolvase RusA-like endonuclease
MRRYVLTHGAVPRSFNETRTAHWRAAQREKKEWQEVFCRLIMLQRVPSLSNGGQLAASATLRFPKRRRRDEGNYRTPVEKALGDALTAMRVLPDDTPEHWRFDRLTIEEHPGPARTQVVLALP